MRLAVGNYTATAEGPAGNRPSRLIRQRRRPKGRSLAPCFLNHTALLSASTTVFVVAPAATPCTRITDDLSLPSLRVADVLLTACHHPITIITGHHRPRQAATMVLQTKARQRPLGQNYVTILSQRVTHVTRPLLMRRQYLLMSRQQCSLLSQQLARQPPVLRHRG